MFYFLYVLKYHKKYFKYIFLEIILSVIYNLMSILLAITSGWLLTSTFLLKIINDKIEYNYIIPAIIIRVISITKILTKYYEKLIKHNTTLYLLKNLRIIFLKKIFYLYPSNLIKLHNIEILNILISNIEVLDFLYIQIVSPILSILITIIIIFFSLSIFNIFISYIIFSILCIFLLFYSFYFYNKGEIIGIKNIIIKEKYYFAINNFLSYQIEYKIFEGIKYIRKKIDLLELKWQKIQSIKNNNNIKSEIIIIITINIIILILLIYSHNYIYDIEQLKYFIVSFLLFLTVFLNVLLPLSNVFQNISEILFASKKIIDILKNKPTIFFPKNNFTINKLISIDIDNLSFSYGKKTFDILKNITLNIKNNNIIAITGHNGCGKSTLLMLLTRSWDTKKGNIYLNKCNIKKWDLFSLRKNISVVNQKIYLFSDTLKNNILLYNQNNKNISDEYLKKILKLVGLNKLLNTNQGLNIWMGDGGRTLSGGELKKLGIIRSIIHGGSVILLDEPTEGLDITTSKYIFKLILSVFKKKIIVIATHDINIIKKVSHIYFMDNGSLIENGKYDDLVTKKGYYWNYIKNDLES
ncbi:ATP-binding cassette domain-containing protein [Enterobacteriaceae endosymbiont of Donacia tomentosa]|uniref:ATP-binding cassette domain-containing protein n=1 Tax=Enterobacteriaceae endosymbiont of Donacia tomentosa TaxID=2675787 RepID=UPI001449D38D|nr:ATP-binding cassette domain-containing protein [Enterobacteriaceae endosymbiont of Donacia tomentosa]QJC31855.1 ATP-binding cassette domain-containing protein [Enterobacteriaceae endosymbiont of Donacia tomentosa]